MTKVSEYLDHLRRQGIEIEVTQHYTLWALPELIDWESREDVIRFLGLRRQIAHCLVYHEDRLIDWKRCDAELKRLKLFGPKVRRADFELALGTLDGDAAEATLAEDERRKRQYQRSMAALTGDWK